MSLIKKHYEKIVLAIFLLIFIASLIRLIVIFSKSLDITAEDLRIRFGAPDYNPASMDELQALENLAEQTVWLKAIARKEGEKDFTALLNPFEIARCPADKGCGRLIPASAFGDKCPLCGCPLEPVEIIEKGDDGTQDSDRDGIPDLVETKAGLDPNNPADAEYDLDGDGFSNLYEYLAGTDMTDPKSRPPLAERLSLKGVRRTRLPMVLKKVIPYGDEKESWQIQADVVIPNRGRRTQIKKLGDNIQIGKEFYKIVDIEHKTKEVFNPGINAHVEVDISEIFIQKKNDDIINAIVDEPVYEPRIRVVLQDYERGKPFVVRQGDTFNMGSPTTGQENYVVTKISVTDESKDGDKFVIVTEKDGEKSFKIGSSPKATPPKSGTGVRKMDQAPGDPDFEQGIPEFGEFM